MCAVLSKADLTSAVPGMVIDTYASPSQHSCTWGDRQSSSTPHVAIATYLQTSKPSTALGGRMVNIAGRDTLVSSDKGGQGLPASCSAKTAAKSWPNGFGNNSSADAADGTKPITVPSATQLVEEPEVSVYANQPEDQLCQTAQTLAAKWWAHVPPGGLTPYPSSHPPPHGGAWYQAPPCWLLNLPPYLLFPPITHARAQ